MSAYREFHHLIFRGDRCEELFYSRNDFYSGMNCLALAAYEYDIRLPAFCFLHNHGHIIDYSTPEYHKKFVVSFRVSIAKNINALHNFRGVFGGDSVNDSVLGDEDDVKDAICYCLRNPLHHKIETNFWRYPYSSVRLYYNHISPHSSDIITDSKVIKSFLPCHKDLPLGFIMNKSGFILPQAYVDTMTVESLFGGEAQFNTDLSRVTEREKRGEEARFGQEESAHMNDSELISVIERHLKSLNIESRICQLTILEKYEILNYLSRLNFNCSKAQIARILDIPYTTVCYRMKL